MNTKNSFFDVASKVFWLLLIVIAIMSIFHLDFGIFKTQKIAEEIVLTDSLSEVIQIDSGQSVIDDDTLKNIEWVNLQWEWTSFDNRKYKLSFQIDKKQVFNASANRQNSNSAGGTLYAELYEFDKNILQNMIDGYRNIIKENNLDYYSALNMVVTSIQSIPYTLVLNSEGIKYKGEWVKCPCQTEFGYFKGNCSVMPNGDGCCNDIEPWGVFSPVEFATRKTGDCDTRSLFAYTILSHLGFDVAIMGSRGQGHSVLGVKVSAIPGDGRRGDELSAREYFLWELTSYGHRLGGYIKGNDWTIEYN